MVGPLDTPELRKARGAFFTPPQVCAFIARWALRSPGDRVFEPSCGDAEFLVAAVDRLSALGAPGAEMVVDGVELHEASAERARQRLRAAGAPTAGVHQGDFFDHLAPRTYDAVIGNPPYVRYQDFAGDARAKSRSAALAAGVPLSKLASSWAAFTVHAAEHLSDDGRLGLVLPAELLTVNYAAEVRAFLLRRFASVRLVLFEELVFPGVLEEVVLLLAEGRGPTDHFELQQVRDLAGLERLAAPVRWTPAIDTAKWSPALLGDAAGPYSELVSTNAFCDLEQWGATSLGMVTGNNRFFALTDEDARSRRLTPADLLPIAPPGSKHLRGLTYSTAAWEAQRSGGDRVHLFRPPDKPGRAALAYIRHGEDLGVDDAYKCRVRKPWWQVPLVQPPDLFITYMNDRSPAIASNRAGVRFVNSVHGIYLHERHGRLGRDLLPIAALSTVTRLSAELVGRAYGGGMLKLEPKEADRLVVPSMAALAAAETDLRAARRSVTSLLQAGNLDGATDVVDGILLRHVHVRELDVLRTARQALFSRRRARGKSA